VRQLIGTPDEERIMLLRIEDEVDFSKIGFVGTDSYLPINSLSPKEVADKIIERHRTITTPISVRKVVSPVPIPFPSDARPDFKIYKRLNDNRVPKCAQLWLGDDNRSTYQHFYLMPKLLCGTETVLLAGVRVEFGVRRVELRLQLSGCEIYPNGFLVGASYHPSIRAQGGNTWIIEGPREHIIQFPIEPGDQSVLARLVIGDNDNILCEINAFEKRVLSNLLSTILVYFSKLIHWRIKKRYNIIIEIWCQQLHIIYGFVPKRNLNRNQELILGAHINDKHLETLISAKNLKDENGFVKLCSVDFDVMEVRDVE
jgi:hypothetical protein